MTKLNYIIRNNSILTQKNNLEPIYIAKSFPVYMGCTDEPNIKNDIFGDLSCAICKDTGIIQLNKVLPLDLVYLHPHNDAIGIFWQKHNEKFCAFINKYQPNNIIEIGGGSGKIAEYYTAKNKSTKWTIIDPRCTLESQTINVVNKWFDEDYTLTDITFDCIIHSNLLEHIYYPQEFMQKLSFSSPIGCKQIFSMPDLYEALKHKHASAINFEHTTILTEDIVDKLLLSNGFAIIGKEYLDNTSIFYATERVSTKSNIIFNSKYNENKELFNKFVLHYKKFVRNTNKQLKLLSSPTYLFGGHIFSQYLLNFGLDQAHIVGILDNSPLKQNKRLYGTPFYVYNPQILANQDNAVVILNVAIFRNEIYKQLMDINPKITILET